MPDTDSEVNSIKEALSNPKRKGRLLSRSQFVSTGSTLLNLSCSNSIYCGFQAGRYYYLVGDSTSGKTWLSLTCFAEAQLNKSFKDYRLIFDDVEGGALMDIEHYFGKGVAEKMEPPSRNSKGEAVYSSTVESFYYHITDRIEESKKTGIPFIYVLDSQDALGSLSSVEKFMEQKKAWEEGKDAAGSYGDGKAKYHSENIRGVITGLKETNSILIIIGQTRDNLGMGFEKKTRSGGRALRFYASLEIWTSVGSRITKTVRGKPRTIGVFCKAEVKKNRVSGRVGKDREVMIPIYYELGIDDVGSCVDYLIAEKHWEQKKQTLDAEKDLGIKGTRDSIIKFVEENGKEEDLRKIVGRVWREIDAESIPKRKRRYE